MILLTLLIKVQFRKWIWLLGTGIQCLSGAVSIPAKSIKVTGKTCTTIDITWNRGNGQLCLVTCRKASVPMELPNDGWTYFPDARYGIGTDLGNGNYCVFSGIDSFVHVRSLKENTEYIFQVFELDYNPFVYLTSNTPSLQTSTFGFTATLNTSILDSCKKRNRVHLDATVNSPFPITSYEWKFSYATFKGNNILAHLEHSGDNNFTLNLLPEMGCAQQHIKSSFYIIPGADSARILTDTAICTGDPELFSAAIYFGMVPKTGYTRTWEFDKEYQTNTLRVFRKFYTTGPHHVSIIVHSLKEDVYTGCSDTFDRSFIVKKATTFSLGKDTCLRKGDLVILSSPIKASYYKWNNLGTGKNYFVTDTGLFFLEITDAQGCTFSDSLVMKYCAANILDELKSQDLKLFTTESRLHWHSMLSQQTRFNLYNVSGQLLENIEIAPGTSGSLDLQSGIYFIRAQHGAHTKIWIP